MHMSPGNLNFNKDLNEEVMVNWEAIKVAREKNATADNARENELRKDFHYKEEYKYWIV